MSKLFNLDKRDFIKGGVMFVGSAVVSTLLQMLGNGGLEVNWVVVLNSMIVATLTYLLKNISTDSNDKIAGKL